jgi:hypothetical protein
VYRGEGGPVGGGVNGEGLGGGGVREGEKGVGNARYEQMINNH